MDATTSRGEAAASQAREQIRALGTHYRSGHDDLARDFFSPCLGACQSYRRATGYFSSSALTTWSAILPKLARGDDTEIQLLVAPVLVERDKHALEQIIRPEERDRFLTEVGDRIVLDALSFADSPNDLDIRLRLFTWLVAAARLELRFAFPIHIEEPGIFHEKIGFFSFPWGDAIAFTGSANESLMGHSRNYETIDVYRSWVAADAERVQIKSRQFDEAWNAEAAGLDVVTLSEDVLRRVQKLAPADKPVIHDGDGPVKVPAAKNKWKHQDEAIETFFEHERGILEMATGTGKTRTAIRICEQLLSDDMVETVIIAADGVDLLNQWYVDLLDLRARTGRSLMVSRHFDDKHERDRLVLQPQGHVLLISRPALAPVLRRLDQQVMARTVLIHDEVHRLGSPGNRSALDGLSTHIRFRLGLSATPDREYDSDGNDFVEGHVGPVIFRFELTHAIRRGVLAPFDYYPLEYLLSDEDRERLSRVYKRVAARKHAGNPMAEEEIWIELSRVYKTSRAKLPVFDTFVQAHQELLERCIVFVETMEYGDSVLEILHRYRPDFHTYYGGEDSSTLHRFATGDLACLLTCHRLSEGIDIRSLRSVVLFSSARARLETIQRIGRCLRSDPDNPGKRAAVVDFIRVAADSDDEDFNADAERRVWLEGIARTQPEEV